jgi:uncharacterized membrane protein YpjA
MGATSVGNRLDALVARHFDASIPEARGFPRYVAPLPEWLENIGLRLAWPVVIINLIGTVFGFWYYQAQMAATPIVMWPLVPDSPLGTLYMALSLAAWRLGKSGRGWELLHVLAFFACLKYGLWSVFVQLFVEGPGYVHPAMWQFLIWSHAAMALQAFLIHRYAKFPVWAVGVVTAWFTVNDVFDLFLTFMGGPHHTWLNVFWDGVGWDRTIPAYDHMVAGAVVATFLAIFLALATRMEILKLRTSDGG